MSIRTQEYEQRTRRTHDYDRIDDSYDLSTTGSTYRSAMSPRKTNVRSRPSGLGASGVQTRVFQSFQSTGGSGSFGPGLAGLVNFPGIPMRGSTGASTALVGFNATRHRDKRDLEHLNDKFAQYIEKVRFLEAQNRKLQLELDALRSRAGQGSSRIKEMYDIEMSEAHKLIDDTRRDAAAAQVKAQQAEDDVKRQRARYNEIANAREPTRREIDAIERQISENEAQINLFRRRLADLDDESRRYKAQAQRLSTEIGRLQTEIQNERFLKTSCDVEKLALEDEIATLKHMHEADLTDLRSQSVSTDLDPSQFFRNELQQAIREIRNDYENVVDTQRNDMQNRYQLLYNELVIQQNRPGVDSLLTEQQRRQEERVRSQILQTQNESAFLKARNQDVRNRVDDLTRRLQSLKQEGGANQLKVDREIADARARLEQSQRDFEAVTNMKTSLEKEITTYRDLLESQNGLRGYVDRIVQSAEQQALERPRGNVGGGSTVISRTTISSTGAYGGAGTSGISSILSTPTRPTATGYSTISSGLGATFRSTSSSVSPTRRSGDY